ncbi:hypothetical protein, partial [Hyphomonas sp.]|uniref:hypothetical protein n=1 Tax=Hyphomonas sp. TaxID=87 RepID=UPI0025B8B6D1
NDNAGSIPARDGLSQSGLIVEEINLADPRISAQANRCRLGELIDPPIMGHRGDFTDKLFVCFVAAVGIFFTSRIGRYAPHDDFVFRSAKRRKTHIPGGGTRSRP